MDKESISNMNNEKAETVKNVINSNISRYSRNRHDSRLDKPYLSVALTLPVSLVKYLFLLAKIV